MEKTESRIVHDTLVNVIRRLESVQETKGKRIGFGHALTAVKEMRQEHLEKALDEAKDETPSRVA